MSLENPIKQIRKAIKGLAEESASREFLQEPEKRHYDNALALMKSIREIYPDKIENTIKITAEAQEMKEELGPAFDVFNAVANDVTTKMQTKVSDALLVFTEREDLTDENAESEYRNLTDRIVGDILKQIRYDERIGSAFTGKEDSLNKLENYWKDSLLNMFDLKIK